MPAKPRRASATTTSRRAAKAPARQSSGKTPARATSPRGGMTRNELYEQAKKLGIAGASRLSKDEMLAAVNAAKTEKANARANKKAAKAAVSAAG